MRRIILTLLIPVSLNVSLASQKEIGPVAFALSDGTFVSSAAGATNDAGEKILRYNCSATKLGAQQTFYIEDVDGGDLDNGNDIYIYGKAISKETGENYVRYWKVDGEYLCRGMHPVIFKIFQDGDSYYLMSAANLYLQVPAGPADYLRFGPDWTSALKLKIEHLTP